VYPRIEKTAAKPRVAETAKQFTPCCKMKMLYDKKKPQNTLLAVLFLKLVV
jgi:hypothetical protein